MLSTGFLQLARKLIAADTVSANGTRGAAELLRGLYEHAGLSTREQVVDGIHVNVLGGPGGDVKGPGGVLLVTHLDTVPAGPGWQTDAWTLTEKDGWLFGLGVADVKLDALCKAEAARRLQGRPCARPFWLLGTFGEEVGLRGARHFVGSPEFADVRPSQVLCGEPSELKVISAHKGYCVVRCTLRDTKARLVSSAGPGVESMSFGGKAAHSSTPHLGVNAILRQPNLWRALATASALEELWQQLLPRDRDDRFDPPGALGGLNVVESGDRSVSLQLDARLLPSHDPDRLIEAFTRDAKRWVDRLGGGEIELDLETLRNAGGMAAPHESKLVRAVQKVLRAHGRDANAHAKPTSTEGGVFARAGCEVIVFGPGISTGNAHTANERIEMAQLEAACDLYEAILVELCACT
jgi:acetylornithine deacetylase